MFSATHIHYSQSFKKMTCLFNTLCIAGVLDEITLRGERWLVTTEDFSNSQDRLAAGQQCMHLLNLVAKYVL